MQNSDEVGRPFSMIYLPTYTAWRSACVGFKTKAGPIPADQTHPWLSVLHMSRVRPLVVVLRSGKGKLLQFCLIFRTKRLSETDMMPEPEVSKTKVEKEHDASKKAAPPLADNDAQG